MKNSQLRWQWILGLLGPSVHVNHDDDEDDDDDGDDDDDDDN